MVRLGILAELMASVRFWQGLVGRVFERSLAPLGTLAGWSGFVLLLVFWAARASELVRMPLGFLVGKRAFELLRVFWVGMAFVLLGVEKTLLRRPL